MKDSFILASNAEILLVSLLCSSFIIIIASKVGVDIFNKFWNLILNSAITTPLLFSFQLVILFFLPAYRNVVIIYLFLFSIGMNLYILITPSFLKERFSYLVLIPLVGLIVLSVLGAYFIGFNIQITLLGPALLFISLVASFIQFKFSREEFVSIFTELKADYKRVLIAGTGIATPLIFCLIFPVLLSDYSTSAYRIGPDLATYAKMSQFFLDGGTWVEAGKRAEEFAGMSVGEINRYCDATMSWPVNFYFRWGLTAYQVVVSVITFTKHSYETAFISLAVPYLLLCGFVLIWLKNQFHLGVIASILGALAFAFNANITNLWYEGFYGNSFALVFFAPILYAFIHCRGGETLSKIDFIKSISFLSILIAASLTSYSEGVVFVLPVFIVFIFIFDLLFTKRTFKWSPYLILSGSAVIALLIVLPCNFFIEWVVLAIQQLTQEGGNGYTQPVWALPSEILGLQNIYFNTSVSQAVNFGQFVPRSKFDLVFAIIISGFVLYFIFVFFRKNRNAGIILYYASISMVTISVCYVLYKSPHNNYTFMKMYNFHLPFFFVLFWGSLNVTNYLTKLFSSISNWIFVFAAIPIIISGMGYIIQYKNQSIFVDKKKIELHQDIKQINFDNVVTYPSLIAKAVPGWDIPHVQHYNRIMLPAILPTPWMFPSRWNDKLYFKNFLDHKVYLFIEKYTGRNYLLNDKNIVFENESYLILDSGHKIRDGLNSSHDSIKFATYTNLIPRKLDADKIEHNLKEGLPDDFDPRFYLKLNPGLQEFWKSKGINESGQELLNHAEIHYKYFGAKDGWKYRGERINLDSISFEK